MDIASVKKNFPMGLHVNWRDRDTDIRIADISYQGKLVLSLAHHLNSVTPRIKVEFVDPSFAEHTEKNVLLSDLLRFLTVKMPPEISYVYRASVVAALASAGIQANRIAPVDWMA